MAQMQHYMNSLCAFPSCSANSACVVRMEVVETLGTCTCIGKGSCKTLNLEETPQFGNDVEGVLKHPS